MKKIAFILVLAFNTSLAQTLLVEEKVKFLALGDSYTIGESVLMSERWPVQLINRITNEKQLTCEAPRIIATTGWRTDQLKSAIINASIQPNEYNLISLLIGVNNQYQNKSVESYKPEFEELLNMVIALAGGDKRRVFVVSIPDYGYTPFGKANQEEISNELDAYNAANKEITDRLGIKYFNITPISRRGLAEPELVANDGLHPSGKMYAEWVDLIMNDTNVEFIKAVITNTKKRNEEASLKLYPNPFSNFIEINNNQKLPIQLTIRNNDGCVVYTEQIFDDCTIETKQWISGLYHIVAESNTGTVLTEKIIKE